MRGLLCIAGVVAAMVVPAANAAAALLRPATDPGVRIAAVGDMACKNPPGNNLHVCRYDGVSDLIAAGRYQAFLALGDEQYEEGRYPDYIANYDAYFGRLLPITYPVPGNREYGTADAAGYFQYFGDIARAPAAGTAFDLGCCAVIALNWAICSPSTGAPCGPGTPEYAWLKADLAAHPNSGIRARSPTGIIRCWTGRSIRTTPGCKASTTTAPKPFWKLL